MKQRWQLLAGMILTTAAVSLAQTTPTQKSEVSNKPTVVIVHGAWGGSYEFKMTGNLLADHGYRVYRPSLTGQGERMHLASPNVGIQTHIDDVVNTILCEELDDIVLIGHSYGGSVITGVADRVPDRIAHLIYLDAVLPYSGESGLSFLGVEEAQKRIQEAQDGFLIPTWVQPNTPIPHAVPMPLKAIMFDSIKLVNQEAVAGIRGTYILTIDPGAETDRFSKSADRARKYGWQVVTMEADHVPQLSQPHELANVLERVIQQRPSDE